MAVGGAFLTLAVLGSFTLGHHRGARLGVHRARHLRAVAHLAGRGSAPSSSRSSTRWGFGSRSMSGFDGCRRRSCSRCRTSRSSRRWRSRAATCAYPGRLPQALSSVLTSQHPDRGKEHAWMTRRAMAVGDRAGREEPFGRRGARRRGARRRREAPRRRATTGASSRARVIRHGETDCARERGPPARVDLSPRHDVHDALAVRHVHRRDPAVQDPARGHRREPHVPRRRGPAARPRGRGRRTSIRTSATRLMQSSSRATPTIWNEDIGEE